MNREKNRNGDTAEDLIRTNDKYLQEVFKRHRKQQSMNQSVRDDDFADGGCFPNCRIYMFTMSTIFLDDDDDEDEDGGSESD